MPGQGGIAQRVLRWRRQFGRQGLPWQDTQDPYRVWLSEIMLQQTQVATVLGYYARFLQHFPDVAALAAASLDEVLAQWSGLGYYSRARNLHRCAQAVVTLHAGRFPTSAEVLITLPGIGRSTAAAIAAFCFGERVAILDGNVKRVLGRVLAFEGDLAQAAQERQLWALATAMLPAQGIEPYTQGVMDLGAGLCRQRAPSCLLCPVRSHCAAGQAGDAERFPVKSRKLKRSQREHHWLSLVWRGQHWLVQRPAEGIWAGLWSLCEFDDAAALQHLAADWPGQWRSLPSFTHVLTHLDWRLHPVQLCLPDVLSVSAVGALAALLPSAAQGRWVPQAEVPTLGLPAALRKLLDALSVVPAALPGGPASIQAATPAPVD
jgi:A/G-specific adenine glycosylase